MQLESAIPEPQPHVLIIGAGITGLVLAQSLKHHSIPFTVFERDPNASHRGKGWGITFHWALDSLLSLLPPDLRDRLPETYVNPEHSQKGVNGNFLFFDLDSGAERWRVPPARRIRVRREGLRRLLMEGVDVKWSKSLASLSLSGPGIVSAHFTDGTSSQGTILVGADGIHSRTRSALLSLSGQPASLAQNNVLPVHVLGATVDYGPPLSTKLRNIDPFFFQGANPRSDAFLYFSFLDTPSSVLARDGRQTDLYRCQILVSYPYRKGFLGPEDAPPLDPPVGNAEKVELMKRIAESWAEPFREIVLQIPGDGETEVKALQLEDWVPRPGMWDSKLLRGRVTLVGDAAHAMTMFRGEGANHAIMDIAVLVKHLVPALQLTSPLTDLEEAVGLYEQEMIARGGPAVLTSRRACLDAHEYERINESSPLISRRAMIVDE